ncbi:MAG: DUF262 domain-containing protein, partial [Gemmatimonadetes bacterium]|nr:DUF262 domain-containing protein [Gemmatimonadota bacterium]
HKRPDGSFGVVDGQQRLTTIQMTLCAIRNAFDDYGLDDLANGTHGLVSRRDINDKERFVLHTETSYPYLQDRILDRKGRGGQPDQAGSEERALQAAYAFLETQVTEALQHATAGGRPSTKANTAARKVLERLRARLLALKLIVIEIDDEDDAYLVFETLNTRGRELRLSDLVKNYVLRHTEAGKAKMDRPRERWDGIVGVIEESGAGLDVDSFLHHYWVSVYPYVPLKSLYRAIKKEVKPGKASELLATLEHEARLYREVHETQFGNWTNEEAEITRSLDAMGLFRVKLAVPMVLSIVRAYRAGKLTRKQAFLALSSIERFHFAFTAVTSQRSSGGISLMYNLHARKLGEAPTKDAAMVQIRGLTDKLRSRRPSYEEFEPAFLELRVSRQYTKQRKLVQYVLRRMHDRFATGPPTDHSQMTIEHVAPERPGGRGGPPSESVASIGNLLWVSREVQEMLRNRPFAEKKAILEGQDVWIGAVMAKAGTWDKPAITRRAKELAKLAYGDVWKP